MKTELKSIAEELVDCRAASADSKVGDPVWCCHHKVLLEMLREPAENRIMYIMTKKPERERAARLRCFRPWVGPIPAELDKADAELAKACAERAKAYAERAKAYAELAKASATLDKASATLDKACAERDKADAELAKACTERAKAYDEWATPAVHAAQWPDNVWVNGRVLGT